MRVCRWWPIRLNERTSWVSETSSVPCPKVSQPASLSVTICPRCAMHGLPQLSLVCCSAHSQFSVLSGLVTPTRDLQEAPACKCTAKMQQIKAPFHLDYPRAALGQMSHT